jgi:hypothetical protein
MTEICSGMVVELLLYLKWTEVYTQLRARNPPHHPVVGSPRVTIIIDVFKIVDLHRLVQRLNRSDD